jgi:hypothetical protein
VLFTSKDGAKAVTLRARASSLPGSKVQEGGKAKKKRNEEKRKEKLHQREHRSRDHRLAGGSMARIDAR